MVSPRKALVLFVLFIFISFCSSPKPELVINEDLQSLTELDSMSLDSLMELYPEREPLWEYAVSEDSIGIEDVKIAVETIVSEGRIPIFYYGADWCAPCTRIKKIVLMRPEIKEVLNEFGFIYVDLSGNVAASEVANELQAEHKIRVIPRFVRSDRELNKLRGLTTSNWNVNKELNLSEFGDHLKEDDPKRGWISMTGPIDSITPYKSKNNNE